MKNLHNIYYCILRRQWKEWQANNGWNFSELEQNMNLLIESTLWVMSRIRKNKCRPGLIRIKVQSLKNKDKAQPPRTKRQIPYEDTALTDSRLVIITNSSRKIFSKCWGETTINLQFCALSNYLTVRGFRHINTERGFPPTYFHWKNC